ncbi:Alpha/Beta hydrolase protein [Dactylonectria macrodidyma]|uniref:Alpha/Beta hydrolase protein n=1 Tax=Dactylonectria macrodidyma TaxID=307937 RepID=A0A9P9FSF4_9HYPO|nr:Alpha/Beta hydrolase protein [Dactylonectria macrodidyma]
MATDLFPGFTRQFITTSDDVSIFVRAKLEANKPPLLLLHGLPQTHAEFHPIIPSLLPHYSIVLMDLRGYGASSAVSSTNGFGYSKRLMAQDCVFVMAELEYDKFTLVGHDREKLAKVVVVDIIPTAAMYSGFGDAAAGLRAHHWLFLAQADPFPKRMINGTDNGKMFLDHTLATRTKKRNLDDFSEAALEEYRDAYCTEERIPQHLRGLQGWSVLG